jgi:type 1 glutamine amidotransferase
MLLPGILAALAVGAATSAFGYDVLVFSKTGGFRHGDQITAGQEAIQQLGSANGFTPTFTEDAAAFTASNLASYEAVVFLNTTGDVLDAEQQTAMENYIAAGGGYAGVHSASDTEYGWSWYGGLIGAYFADHPPGMSAAAIDVLDSNHPSTSHLAVRFTHTDEWYNFQSNPAASVHVLLDLDETTYTGGTMGASHPIAWYHDYAGGRAWYTGLGHNEAVYAEPWFRQHLLGAIQYAANVPEPASTVAVVTVGAAFAGRRRRGK